MLPRSARLRNTRDFRRVYAQGRSYVHPLMVVHLRTNRGTDCRIGFSVGKKLGDAVARNRVKRRLREAFRQRLNDLRGGVDIVVVGRKPALTAPFAEVCAAVNELLVRAGCLKE